MFGWKVLWQNSKHPRNQRDFMTGKHIPGRWWIKCQWTEDKWSSIWSVGMYEGSITDLRKLVKCSCCNGELRYTVYLETKRCLGNPLELGKWTSRWAKNTFKQAEGRKIDITFIWDKRIWKCKFPFMFSTSPKKVKCHQWIYMDLLGGLQL